MDKKITELKDSFELKISKKQCKELKDSVESNKTLVVKIKATHGGYTNGNRFHYSIDSMEAAASTWINPFPKPVLLHHDELTDPIGRVTDAEFVLMKTNRKDKPKGHILLTCRITDKEAIDKILDGRYMTVSVGSKPKSATCSICDRDVVNEGMCDHTRGASYEDKLCYWTVNIDKYTEVSFVNKPADEYQKGIESKELSDKTQDDIEDVEVDINKAEFYLEDKETEIKSEEEYKLNEDNIDNTWSQEDIEMINWLIDEMKNDPEFKDAKLSTTARKKLSSKVFCGPDRSFPVNDCAHYSAALRLLNKYKGSGDKNRIKSCIERRGKSLGCPGATKTKDEENMVDEQMKKELDELKIKFSDLTKESEKIKAEKTALEAQIVDKTKEIDKINNELISFKAEKHSALADKVYDLRIKLGKKDVIDLKDNEIKIYKETLSKRTDESLKDSMSDLETEIEAKKETKPAEPTTTVVKDSVDKPEKQTSIKDNIAETNKVEDLGDILNKKK